MPTEFGLHIFASFIFELDILLHFLFIDISAYSQNIMFELRSEKYSISLHPEQVYRFTHGRGKQEAVPSNFCLKLFMPVWMVYLVHSSLGKNASVSW